MRYRRIAVLALILAASTQAQFNFGSTALQRLTVDSQNRDTLWAHTSTSVLTGAQTLYRSTDQGSTWVGIPFSSVLGTPIAAIRSHRTLAGYIYVLTGKAGGYLWTTDDGGATWRNPSAGWAETETPQQLFVATLPSRLVYVQIGTRIRRSTDGGFSFNVGGDTPCTGPVEVSPAEPTRLACVNTSDDTLYVSTDQGESWSRAAKPPADQVVGCTIVNDFTNPLVYFVYCLTTLGGLQRDQYFRSTDGLQTLTPSTPSPNGLPRFYVSPDRSNIIVTGSGSTTNRSRDLGQTWQSIGTSVQSDFAFDPYDANVVYRDGNARSTDGGSSFTAINQRQHLPLFYPLAPLEVTLESGTVYTPTVEVKALDGVVYTESLFTITTPTEAPWLQTTPVPLISTAGLTAGTYEASFGLNRGSLLATAFPVKLRVIAPRDPPVFLRATRIAGTGIRFTENGEAVPFSNDLGPATSIQLPTDRRYIASDFDGNVFLAYRYRVQKIDTAGRMRSFAGTGAPGTTGDGGQAAFATFRDISDILYTDHGLLILDRTAGTIRLARSNSFIEAFYTPVGFSGPSFFVDTKMATDSTGALFLADSGAVYRWDGGNRWTSVFTHASVAPAGNGSAGYKSFIIDKRNNSFLVAYKDRIVRRTVAGQVTVLLGTPGKTGFAGDGNNTATGSLTDNPNDLAVDAQGNIYFTEHNRIRIITSAGVIGTVAGDGVPSTASVPVPADNSPATSHGFGTFFGTHARPNGELFSYGGSGFLFKLTVGSGPTSSIDTGGVVTLAGKAKIAPGAIFSVYGKLLADGVVNDPTPPLKTKLGSTSVQVNGVDIPLFYVSPTQINAQMPYNIPVGTASVRVVSNGTPTAEQTVQIVAAAPDVIQYGAGRAVAVNQNGSVNGAGTPAPVGSYVVLYLTGIGVVSPGLTAGQAAPLNPLSQTSLPHKITLSNGATTVDVTPLFLGHTPTYAGLVQANFQIPNLAAGDYNLTLTVGAEASNVTKLAIGN